MKAYPQCGTLIHNTISDDQRDIVHQNSQQGAKIRLSCIIHISLGPPSSFTSPPSSVVYPV